MVKIVYNTKYNAQNGEVIFTTECTALTSIKVGSDDCRRCRYFRAITFKQQVECGRPVEVENLHTQNSPYVDFKSGKEIIGAYVEAGGCSATRPYNLSYPTGKPVQTQIQFK